MLSPFLRAGNSKKYRKHRTPPARPHSPYSTDSNMSAVVHKPYPKSDRKKQLLEQGTRNWNLWLKIVSP